MDQGRSPVLGRDVQRRRLLSRLGGLRLSFSRLGPAALLVGLTAACSGHSASATHGAAGQASPAEAPVNLATADLPARWWQWSEAADPTKNPIDDPDGSQCSVNQPPGIWFLAGTHGGSAVRSCTVPAGRPIYFPVINQVCQFPSTQSDDEAAFRCKGLADVATATLDRSPLSVKEAESDGAFQLIGRPGSVSVATGKHKSFAWGLWVGPVALSRGPHELTFLGRSGDFETNVTYHLSAG